uniref:Putative cell wall protein iff6 n=1 Tax=Anopheles triannulatus TaxID=58253 RepID=A0A2M4AF81_9DIPT
MATVKDSATFFQHGNSAQFEFVLGLYPKALRLKADARGVGKKADKLIRLEEWYQNELPKLIKKRGRDAHLQHEELVQTMEWKQTRGKFYPQLSYLIKVNTPRAVVMETKKAFRKLPNLEQALNALSNLKGVGITMASALLAAAIPESAPFMADECLMAIPDFEGIDYTTKEYLKFVTHIQQTMDRLNAEVEGTNSSGGGSSSSTGPSNGSVANAADGADSTEKDPKPEDSKEKDDEDEEEGGGGTKTNGAAAEEKEPETPTKGGKKGAADAANGGADAAQKPAKKWSAHQVELALWTHYIVNDLQPELLGGMPGNNNGVAVTNGISKDGDDEDVEGNEDVADEEDEDEENGTADDDKALADDGEDDDENSRNAVESSESESNEAVAVVAPVPVANGKAREATTTASAATSAAPAAADDDDGVVSSVQTNNGTSEATEQQPTADGKKDAAPTPAAAAAATTVVESSGLATVDECTKSGDSLDGVLAVPAVAEESPVTAASTATTTLNADDSADSQNSSSHGATKRPLYCEDSTEDKPELSAPKLIKL